MINGSKEKHEADQRTPDLGCGLAIRCGTLPSVHLIFPIRDQYTWLLFIILVDLLKLKLSYFWLSKKASAPGQGVVRALRECLEYLLLKKRPKRLNPGIKVIKNKSRS